MDQVSAGPRLLGESQYQHVFSIKALRPVLSEDVYVPTQHVSARGGPVRPGVRYLRPLPVLGIFVKVGVRAI